MEVTVRDLTGVKQQAASLTTSLMERIKEDILSGRLRDGDKLTEQTICNKYKVSRTPVREALAKLESEGLVEMLPNRGAFVRAMSQKDMEDVLTLRKLYEIQAAYWAAERITEEDLDELEENFEFMEFYTMKNDVEKMLIINRSFHRMIYKATHNRMLARLLEMYQSYIHREVNKPAREDGYLKTVLGEHQIIYEAIRAKNPKAAAKAMEDHLNKSALRRAGQ